MVIWDGLMTVLGNLIARCFEIVFRLMAAIAVSILSVLPTVSMGELDLSPVLNLLDYAGWFLPYAALGVVVIQWIALVGFSVSAFLFRLTMKFIAVARGAAW